jgi:hypothetical protein
MKWGVARVRNFWTMAEKPSFWPSDIPFCSPSAREEIKSGDYESGDYAFIVVENT